MKLKFKESLKSGSSMLRISKEERYKKIKEKINQFKKNKSSSKNVQRSKTSDSLILELLKKERTFFTNISDLFLMDDFHSIDIDTKVDWDIAEACLKKYLKEK